MMSIADKTSDERGSAIAWKLHDAYGNTAPYVCTLHSGFEILGEVGR